MPKKSSKCVWGRRGGKPANCEEKHYFGHDDRVRNDGGESFGNRRRVSFKPQRSHKELPRSVALTLDDDIPMAGSSNNNNRQVVVRGRGRGACRGRNSPLPRRDYHGGAPPKLHHLVPLGETCWYKVIIPYGRKYTKEYVLSNLNSVSTESFVPIMYKVIGSEAIFYVDDQNTAKALLNCDRKITTHDGFKLRVKVKPGCPPCEINDKLKERLKQAMAKRYVQETNALDLSKFHQDPDLIADYFCALSRPVMLMVVLDIVSEYVPSLEALNLDGNKLQLIERLSVLHKKFSKLKILYIGDNRIKEMSQLDVVKDLELEELRLDGNPVCNRYKSRQSDYISDVRKRFPKLLRLDGMELPRPILFDLTNDTVKVPATQRLFAADEKAQQIASQFMQQYFMIYDSENRHPLLNAYDEHARFSLTVSTYGSNAEKLSVYLQENRNLFRVNNPARRQKLLKQGRLPVLSAITELPKTRHNLDTFTMDICVITKDMLLIVVTGLFEELDNKDNPLRYFNRSFIIVPRGTGYCIANEQLHINVPTESQQKLVKGNPSEQQMTEESSTSEATESAVPPPTAVAPPSEEIQQQMILSLSQQTNMNSEWSLKCLQEVQWNYENAMAAFQELFKRGQIPQEAFIK